MLSTALRATKSPAFIGNSNTCFECNGTGYLPEYSHICGGRCFTCSGTGSEKRKAKKQTSEYHFDMEHVAAFQDALQIEHIHAWVDQDYARRAHGNNGMSRY